MNEEKNGDLLRVAQAVSDGIPVAWERESKARPDLSRALDELRGIEAMVAAQLAPEGQTREITAAEQLPEPKTWGRLRLLDLLGRGGYGEVYRAHDPVLQVDVALKLYRATSLGDEAGATRLLDEARRLARVRHANVVVLHGADRHEGEVGIWMELIRGQTLEQWIEEQGPLAAEEAARVGRDLCRALAAVHAAGLVHQDVKTQNVVREQGGRIVLMDFGAGVALAPSGAAALGSSRIVGTPLVMAPEVLRGEAATRASDIYSLGVLLYRLVTRRYPIEAETLFELREKQAAGAVTPLRDLRPDLPAEFIRAVEGALALDPAKRFTSAGEMERALASMGLVETARPARTPPWWAIAAAAVAVVGVALWLGGRRTPQVAGITIPDKHTVSSPATDAPSAQAPASIKAAPVTPPALTASAKLFRVGTHGDERLFSGARIGPGDDLVMDFQSSERVYLYVLDQDQAGHAYVLFPAPGLDMGNPLDGHSLYRLPGTQSGKTATWEVSSAGGREQVIAIASRKPLRDLEREIARFPHASVSQPVVYGQVSDTTMLALRGIGRIGATDGTAASSASPGLSRALEQVPGGGGSTGGVWTWAIDMENPAH